MKRWRDHYTEKLVHAQGAIAAGEFTLCGRPIEGVNGDEPMEKTTDLIQCPACEAIILHCKMIKPAEINKTSRRKIEAARTRKRGPALTSHNRKVAP